jgi:hypothetical protein
LLPMVVLRFLLCCPTPLHYDPSPISPMRPQPPSSSLPMLQPFPSSPPYMVVVCGHGGRHSLSPMHPCRPARAPSQSTMPQHLERQVWSWPLPSPTPWPLSATASRPTVMEAAPSHTRRARLRSPLSEHVTVARPANRPEPPPPCVCASSPRPVHRSPSPWWFLA